MRSSNKDIPVLSAGVLTALILMALMLIAAIYRLLNGLGVATNLSDQVPWGLWIGVDVLGGVALAAGGFAVAGTVVIFNLKKYQPIVRSAILTAFVGYVIVSVSIFFDLSKPWALWHPLVLWQPNSIMFEVVWCVVIYTAVLALEFAGQFFEGMGFTRAAKVMTGKTVVIPLAIAAMVLSFMHQSSLGALFLLIPAKLNHLWWTTMLPYNFFLSAVAAGLAMVSVEYVIGAKVFKHGCDLNLIKGLAKGTATTLLVYFIFRSGDIAIKGNLGLVFEPGPAGVLFIIEMIGLVLLPMIVLFKAAASAKTLAPVFIAQLLVLIGVILNRLDVLLLAQLSAGAAYSPSLIEWTISLGLIATICLAYKLALAKLPIAGKRI